MAVPTFYYAFLDTPRVRRGGERLAQNVRLFTCGSAPIRPEVLPGLEAILGRPVINRYGMTEAHVITSLPLDGPWPQGSVGLPVPGVEVRVTRDDGMTADVGEVGTVQLRGPNLFRAYWRKPDATRAAFNDGWFDTGDLGSRDAQGFLSLAGRKNDLIITNGFNVYPPIVERVINACPGVRESAVLGLPDPRRGERVVAVVVRDDPALDERTLRVFWSERLVDYQRPHAVAFPAAGTNALGKSPSPRGPYGSISRVAELRGRLRGQRRTLDLAWISLAAARLMTIVLSCTTTVNPGCLAVVFAWAIGGLPRPPEADRPQGVIRGVSDRPVPDLVSVTLSCSRARAGQRHARPRGTGRGAWLPGNVGLIPLAFIGLAATIASIGAGNIAAAAAGRPRWRCRSRRGRKSPPSS